MYHIFGELHRTHLQMKLRQAVYRLQVKPLASFQDSTLTQLISTKQKRKTLQEFRMEMHLVFSPIITGNLMIPVRLPLIRKTAETVKSLMLLQL